MCRKLPRYPERHTTYYVLGVIKLRGNVVTVVDTRLRPGLETSEVTDSTRIVIIEDARHVIGILVDLNKLLTDDDWEELANL